MILYKEHLTDSSKNVGANKKCNRVVGHKINIKKSISSLYTNNETLDEEIKGNWPILDMPKNNEICRNRFNQGVKRWYSGNRKILIKEIKRANVLTLSEIFFYS